MTTTTPDIAWDQLATSRTKTDGAMFEVEYGDDTYVLRTTESKGEHIDPASVYAVEVLVSSANFMEGRWLGSLVRERNGWTGCRYIQRFARTEADMRASGCYSWTTVQGNRRDALVALLDAWHFAADGRPLGR